MKLEIRKEHTILLVGIGCLVLSYLFSSNVTPNKENFLAFWYGVSGAVSGVVGAVHVITSLDALLSGD